MIKLDIMKGVFLAVLHCFFQFYSGHRSTLCEKIQMFDSFVKNEQLCDHSLKDSYLLDTTKSLASTVKQLLLTHL